MSKPLSIQPDSPDCADAAARVPKGKGGKSHRVRELPPPPKTSERPTPTPQIATDRSRPTGWRRWWAYVGRRTSSSCAISFFFHFVLLLVLALTAESSLPGQSAIGLVAYTDQPEPLESLIGEETVLMEPDRIDGDVVVARQQYEMPKPADLRPDAEKPADPNKTTIGLQQAEQIDLLQRANTVDGGLAGRGREARAALVGRRGGNKASEQAVERGLRWLMAHGRDDGSWHFSHRNSVCQGSCRNSGTEASTTGATAIALLPFLGAGYTHTEGEYRELLKRGLYYLSCRTLLTPHGYDVQEGTMYAQGLSTIALCEAYAMTGDPALKDYAQGAINYIVYAQNAKGGGWRYTPGEPGDTTVTGWQLMALKSGQMAGLEVPSGTLMMVHRFLSSVQCDYGARYGYMTPQPRNTTTAVGLLLRMYTGWQRDNPGLKRGAAYLSEWGPSEENMYYNYYATQVMHHYEGPTWEKWNKKMRDHLIATQATEGHEAGSWYFAGDYGAKKGGRLYSTAMAVMTLEVYYRYMPLYGREAIEGEF